MKTVIFSLIPALGMGLAVLGAEYQFAAADGVAIVFVTGLMAWTLVQYQRQPRRLAMLPRETAPVRLNQAMVTHASDELPLAA